MQSGSVDSWAVILRAMKQLRGSWPTRGWSWDGRFSCVSSSFSTELEPKARAATSIALPTEFTTTTLAKAPSHLRDLAERTGGLRPGQMLLSCPPVGHAFAYGLWWPWGDGMTTSLRIGIGGAEATQDAFQRLRDAFGVEL